MFRQLFNFGYQRTAVQAIGFYLFYLVTGVVLIALASAVTSVVSNVAAAGSFGFDEGLGLGATLGIVMAGVMSLLVLRAKQLFTHPVSLIVGLLALPGTWAGGLILGLIFVAFLTTRPTRGAASVVDAESRPVEATSAF